MKLRMRKVVLAFIFILMSLALSSAMESLDDATTDELASTFLSMPSLRDTIDIVENDSVLLEAQKKEVEVATKTVTKRKPYELNSTKAVLFSIIPGGGQIYNRKYWKIPIIIGAYTACYYAISWNNANLQEYTTAFKEIKSDRPMDFDTWKDFLPYNANPEDYINNTSFHDQLKRGRDYFRRYRDMSIIISVAVYALVMIDSYVDAELHNFDISPDLSLSYAPAVIPSPSPITQANGYGLHIALTF